MTKKKEPTPKLKFLAPHIIVVINCYIRYKFILFYCRIFHNYAVRLKTQKKIVKRTVYFMYLHLSTTLIYTWLIFSRNQRCKLICLLLWNFLRKHLLNNIITLSVVNNHVNILFILETYFNSYYFLLYVFTI